MSKRVDPDIANLVTISRAVGSDDRLVQAGGGNTSVKNARGTRMHIKASGTGLRDLSPRRGYVTMAMAPLRRLLADRRIGAMSDAKREQLVLQTMYDAVTGGPDRSARPSCEAALHAMLQRYVVHIHPIAVNAILCSKRSEQLCRDLARRGRFTMVWVPYTNPGHPLAARCRDEVAAFEDRTGGLPEVLFIENHGLFVSSESAKRAATLTKAIVNRCERLYAARAGKKRAAGKRAATSEGDLESIIVELRRDLVRRDADARLVQFVPDETAARLLARKDARTILRVNNTPDTMVYCQAYPLILPARAAGKVGAAVDRHVTRYGELPRVVLVPGRGFLVVGDSQKAIHTTIVVFRAQLGITEGALAFGGPKPLGKREVDYIKNWEVEAYRLRLAKAAAGQAGPLSGKVALVTGAGSGIGRGIAVGLAAAGAHVVLADIDLPSAEETAALVAERCGAPRASAVGTDVTCEDSMAAAFRRAALTYGGIDVMVAAAGIAPAFPIQDFPVGPFNKTLAINLTGYFLAGREAARWMIRQATGGSLIFVSSKTGLEASKNNAAYNVTKAGELQLMRGLALELGPHGIRSNAVCPGNVFEGSKIWNPKYIAEAARKRGLKPNQVIPYYVSLTALGKEIRQGDVANAAVFLASDMAAAVSGQALVVDAGQVFVR